MRIRFVDDSEVFGVYNGSQYDIHNTYEVNDKTYYCFDRGDNLPPICVTHASVKGVAVIESGKSQDIYDRLKEEIKEEENVNEFRESESSDCSDEQN